MCNTGYIVCGSIYEKPLVFFPLASDFTQHQFYQEDKRPVTASATPHAPANQVSNQRRVVKPKSKGNGSRARPKEGEESQKSQQETL